jgi:imidazolonepropionase-like amidohydrolase
MMRDILKKPKFRLRQLVSVLLTATLFNTVSPELAAAPQKVLLKAARIFDGNTLVENAGVLITGNTVTAVGDPVALKATDSTIVEMDLGDSTILPGFIELHGHVAFQQVPMKTLLEHGITTLRDVGGPLSAPTGGNGQLRFLSAGPIITVPGGYPIPAFGQTNIAAPVDTPEQARQQVRDLIAGGAAVIKIALEPGGERGAPWTTGHVPTTPPPWPMLSLDTVKAIVAEAHAAGKRVSAHLAENKGVAIALNAGVDEWAHIPCMPVSDALLQRAVKRKVKIVTTIDALSHCPGIYQNTMKLAALKADFLYGAEIAHTDIPWGIDAHELHYMYHVMGMNSAQIFNTATAKAGAYLGLAPLGTLTPSAPADLIAVRGNAFMNFKPLEYPDLVISGGQIIVNKYAP